MKELINRKVLLVNRPQNMPSVTDFKLEESKISNLAEGEVLVQTNYLSVDPSMRVRMDKEKSYTEPYELNQVMTGRAVGQVVESKHPSFGKGTWVTGQLEWADYSIKKGELLSIIDASDTSEISPTAYLSVLGSKGITAYFGLLDIGKPKIGETVVVSGAAGAVGMLVGQIAKMKGCRVVGIAGTEEKIRYLEEELGFDAAIDYHRKDFTGALAMACPDGADIYFDNVGGAVSDAVMPLLNLYARIPLCGQIALYNLEGIQMGPRHGTTILKRRVLVQGFIQSDYKDRYPEAMAELKQWLSEGKLMYRENIVRGLEKAPEAFIGLFKGENIGKQIVAI